MTLTPERPLSHWGWGFADKFPGAEGRREVADLVANLLGVDALALKEPARLEDARVPPSRIACPDALAAFCTNDREARVRHAYGRAFPDLVRGFRGDFTRAPDLVAFPRSEEDVAATLRWAHEARVAVVPYGGGTSVVAGVECAPARGQRGVLSLDVRGLDRVLAVDDASLAARVQAGATGPRIAEQLDAHGLTLRHYPQSFEFSTLGGWIATRAGGHYATLFTHIDDFVESVRMLTPTGAFETRRLPASGAGPDANRLVLGSEGTLGVITEAWIRVQRKPRHRARASVRFAAWEDAVAAVRAIAQSGLHPANCRLLDATEAVLNRVGFDNVLVLGFESADHAQGDRLERALAIARAHGGEPEDERVTDAEGAGDARAEGEARWRQAFLDGPYLFNVLVSAGVLVDTFETCVTWDRFPALDAAVRERVGAALERGSGAGILSCRFTHVYPDGPAPYYTFLAPAADGRELEQWAAVKKVASDVLAEHGATITHHHAVGRTHRDWYVREVPERYVAGLRAVKRELDPRGVLNPGVLMEAPADADGT